MSRRLVAFLIALGLVVALTAIAAVQPVPWVRFLPGPTVNVLGACYQGGQLWCDSAGEGKQLIEVSGHKVYRDNGGLRMVTVRPDGPTDKVSLLSALIAWADPDDAVLPKDAVYKPTQTNKQVQQQSAVQMTSSQDSATAAALSALGVKYRTQVRVASVDKKGASAGILRKGDIVTGVDGRGIADAANLIKLISAVTPGEKVRLSIRRNSTSSVVTVVTRPDTKDKKVSRVNIGIGQEYVFPFKVKFQLSDRIGGPSAGMMFALSLYDLLTPGSLTGGKAIAGSGEITADGIVGPIGGIGQKLAGAQRDGARLFLVAQENCSEAARSHYDRDKLRLVKVHTLQDAITAVDTWRKDPAAALPRCTR